MLHRRILALAIAGALISASWVLGTSEASAAAVRGAVSATASSTFSLSYDVGNTIDHSGLTIGYTSGLTDFDAYLALGPLHIPRARNREWFTITGVTSASLTYDLGTELEIYRLAVWVEESAGFGAFDVQSSVDGTNFTTIATGLQPTDNPADLSYPADVFALPPTLARYIRLNVSGCPQPLGYDYVHCALGEIIFASGCSSGSECDDGVTCTTDSCVNGACTNTPVDSVCDDGLFCNGVGDCNPIFGCGTIPVVVDDGNPCTVDSCDEVNDEVVNAPLVDGSACDDGVACTDSDTCLLGQCSGTPNHAFCDDGAFCDGDDSCDAFLGCIVTPVVIDDGNPCTSDACDEGTEQVSHTPLADGSSCEDGFACTGPDLCQSGVCNSVPNDAFCDDAEFCTGIETCSPAVGCTVGTPPPIDDGNSCTTDLCDEGLDMVVHVSVADGTSCSDGLACTLVDLCQGGVCEPGPASDAFCDDGEFCTGSETCDGLLGCVTTPVALDDGNSCTSDSCDEGNDLVVHTTFPDGTECNDAVLCTDPGTCESGTCQLVPLDELCDDGDPCTVDSCDAVLDCDHAAISGPGCFQTEVPAGGSWTRFLLLVGIALSALAFTRRRAWGARAGTRTSGP